MPTTRAIPVSSTTSFTRMTIPSMPTSASRLLGLMRKHPGCASRTAYALTSLLDWVIGRNRQRRT
jgi:hypothetical protein